MKQTKRTEISELGEFKLIDNITADNKVSPSTIKSIGDDAAVLKNEKETTVITTDFLVEGVHFDLSYTPLKHLGYKAVVVNLSDIYAMNVNPEHITVSIALSNRFSVEAVEELYKGIYLACERYGVDVVGGDTTASTSGLIISITATGQEDKKKLVYRKGAKEGDLVCVTGNLGAAYMGLQILIREKQVFLEDPEMKPEINEKNSYLIERFLKPEAQKGLIAFFEKNNIQPTAMMDISDGLSSEILHICHQSHVGVLIQERDIPIDRDTYDQCMDFNFDPTVAALSGGEDYEMLFTIDPKDEEVLALNSDIHFIGEIKKASEGVKIQSRGGGQFDITAQGWQAFKE